MGKGSGSGSNTATKQTRASSTGTESGGQQEGQSDNSCLFQFTERLLLKTTDNISIGDIVALVQNAGNANQLDVFIGRGRYGQYTGQHLQKILKCMDEKYSYSGTVDSVSTVGSGVEVVCTIRGHSYEQSTTAL